MQITRNTPVEVTRYRSRWSELALAGAAVTLALTTLASLVGVPAALTGAVSPAVGTLLADHDKVWAVVLWASAAICGVACLVLDRIHLRLPGWGRIVITALGAVGLVLTFIFSTWKDAPYPPLPDNWTGFGFSAVVLGGLMSIVAISVVRHARGDNRILLIASATVVGGLAVLSLVQTPTTFVSGYDNSFTLDEVLAPSNGRIPGFDYVNQYGSLLGYPLAIITALLRPLYAISPESFAVGWLVLLQVLTLVGAVWAVLRVTPRALRWLVPLVVIPIAFLVGADGLPYYADLPIRVAIPVALLGLLVLLGMRGLLRSGPWWVTGMLGVVGGIAAFNNLDFGVPALLAGLIAVVAASSKALAALRRAGLYLLGAAAFVLLYIVLGALTGRSYHPEYTFFFVQSFGVAGQNNVDMLPVGLQDGFVILGVVGVAFGALGLRRLTGRNAVLYQAMLFQSVWMLLSLIYFSGRSLTPTLVTGSALQAGILMALLAVSGIPHLRVLLRAGIRTWSWTDMLSALLVLLSLALPLAAWTVFPPVEKAASRLYHVLDPATRLSYLEPSPVDALAEVPDSTNLMGLLSVAGNVWGPKLGVVNSDLFLHPDYLAYSGAAAMECRYLSDLRGEGLVTTRPIAAVLERSDTCRDVLDFGSVTDLVRATAVGETNWVLVPRH